MVGGFSGMRSTEVVAMDPVNSATLCAPTAMDTVFYDAGGLVGKRYLP